MPNRGSTNSFASILLTTSYENITTSRLTMDSASLKVTDHLYSHLAEAQLIPSFKIYSSVTYNSNSKSVIVGSYL